MERASGGEAAGPPRAAGAGPPGRPASRDAAVASRGPVTAARIPGRLRNREGVRHSFASGQPPSDNGRNASAAGTVLTCL